MCLSFNNLGNFFKKVSNLDEALKYYYKSVSFEDSILEEQKDQIGLSHLNICTILSQQGEHITALKHGLKSINIMRKIYNTKPKLIPSMIIAYHNVGTEYKLTGEIKNAEKSFKIGYKTSYQLLGAQHSLTVTLKKS